MRCFATDHHSTAFEPCGLESCLSPSFIFQVSQNAPSSSALSRGDDEIGRHTRSDRCLLFEHAGNDETPFPSSWPGDPEPTRPTEAPPLRQVDRDLLHHRKERGALTESKLRYVDATTGRANRDLLDNSPVNARRPPNKPASARSSTRTASTPAARRSSRAAPPRSRPAARRRGRRLRPGPVPIACMQRRYRKAGAGTLWRARRAPSLTASRATRPRPGK